MDEVLMSLFAELRQRDGQTATCVMKGMETESDGPGVIIRIPMRLERRGGRKLIMTPEGATSMPRKPA